MLAFRFFWHLVRFKAPVPAYDTAMQQTITLAEAIRTELNLWRDSASSSMLGPEWSAHIDELCDDMVSPDCKQPGLALAELMGIIRRFGVISPRIAAPSIARLESHIWALRE